MTALTRNLRYALRQLRANPGFAALAIMSLAIGIGAPTTIFTLINATLLRPLPVRDAGRLVYAYVSAGDGSGFHSFSYPDYADYEKRARSLNGLAAFDNLALSVATTGEPRITLGMQVTGNYFNVLGTTPELGRFFLPEEDGVGSNPRPVAVVSDAFWRTKLAADSSAVGRPIQVNGVPFTVIGVARPEFAEVSVLVKPDVWTTLAVGTITRPSWHVERRTFSTFQVVGRLADGATMPAAERELEGIAKQIERENPEIASGNGVDLYPFSGLPTEARRGISIFMALLMGFGALILAVACGNVASMLLARGIARRREIAIRTALGAERSQVVAQLVTETILLFSAGAGAALALAAVASRAISAFRPPVDIPLTFDVPLDWRVFAFAVVVALVVGFVFGLLPGLRTTRVGVAAVLKEEAGSVAVRSRARSVVVVAQLAFTFMLLVAAGLVARALGGALRLDPGFDRSNVYVALTDMEMARLDSLGSLALANVWRDGVAASPGVSSVALVTRAPLSSGNSTTAFKIVGGEGKFATEFQSADWAAVSPEFFETLKIRLVDGRAFNSADKFGSQRVAIVSEAFAKKFFGSAGKALGRVVQTGTAIANRIVIVGVAADTKVRSLAEDSRPMMYEPFAQSRVRNVTLLAKASRPDMASLVRNELRRANNAVPLMGSMTYDQFIAIALLPQRLTAGVTAILGAAGLLLALVGVYGIIAYSVSQRTKEIGIRMAVGATPYAVVGTIAQGGLRLIGVGVGIGFVLSLAGTRVMGAFLLGVSPTDPMVFGMITLGLAIVAAVACLVPASRAARVDPMVALRAE